MSQVFKQHTSLLLLVFTVVLAACNSPEVSETLPRELASAVELYDTVETSDVFVPEETIMAYRNDDYNFKISNLQEDFVVDEGGVNTEDVFQAKIHRGGTTIASIDVRLWNHAEGLALDEQASKIDGIDMLVEKINNSTTKRYIFETPENPSYPFIYTIEVEQAYSEWLTENWAFVH